MDSQQATLGSLGKAPATWAPFWGRLGRLLPTVGLLAIGAGLCCGVFCALAFRNAAEALPLKLVAATPGHPTVYAPNLEPLVYAYQLLAISLTLGLGGAALWFYGVGLGRVEPDQG